MIFAPALAGAFFCAVLNLRGTLAGKKRQKRKFDEPNYRDNLKKSQRVNGELHPETIKSINAMAALFSGHGEETEAGQS